MKRALKWAGLGLLGLIAVLVLLGAGVYGYTEYRMGRTYDVPRNAFVATADEALIERGRHIATIRGCVDCHGPAMSGRLFVDAPPVFTLFASNLTSGEGGVAPDYTDADLAVAIRHGVNPEGKPLKFMPSHEFNVLSDEDVGAIVAYIRSLAPVDNVLEESSVGPVGRLLFLAGELPLIPAEVIDHQAPRARAPAAGRTPEYGAYLATTCTGCHGAGYSGGPIPGTPPDFPPAANITPHPETGIGAWTEQDFFRALREGVRPDGSRLLREMPWPIIAQMTDDELGAVWAYLRTVPASEYGGR
jgi:mono/diheme cytochrome c family protein